MSTPDTPPQLQLLRATAERACSVPGCKRKYATSGYCGLHYDRLRRGRPLHRPPIEPRPGEEWRPIPGWEDRYEASTLGRIKSRTTTVKNCRGANMVYPERLRKPALHPGGYLSLSLSRDGIDTTHLVHRLVALTFLGEPEPGQQVNHIDGDKQNNRADNLEWVTQHENMRHAADTGLLAPARGEAAGNAKLNRRQVREIRALLKTKPVREIAKRFGVSPRAVVSIRTGRTWRHVK